MEDLLLLHDVCDIFTQHIEQKFISQYILFIVSSGCEMFIHKERGKKDWKYSMYAWNMF